MDMIFYISDKFLTPAAATKAQQSIEKVQYSIALSIHTYIRELQTLSTHVFMPINEYTLRQQIVTAIPQTICHWLINYKNLSTSTLTVVEWVNAVEQQECKREAYNASVSAARRPTSSLTCNLNMHSVNTASVHNQQSVCIVSTTCTSNLGERKPTVANGSMPKAMMAPWTLDRGVPTGHQVPTRQKIPLAKIICHACGKKGHYKCKGHYEWSWRSQIWVPRYAVVSNIDTRMEV